MIDWPIPSFIGETYTSGGNTWQWNGKAWVGVTASPVSAYRMPYLTNQYHTFRRFYSRVSLNVNGQKTTRLFVESDVTIDAISVYVTAAAAASTKMVIGIYESDPVTLYPTNLIVDTGEIPVDTTLSKLVTFSPVNLSAGLYYAAYQFSNGTTGCGMYVTSLSQDGFRVDNINFNTIEIYNFLGLHTYDGTSPATFPVGAGLGSTTNTHVPMILFRVI